jgi:hypothetical protein
LREAVHAYRLSAANVALVLEGYRTLSTTMPLTASELDVIKINVREAKKAQQEAANFPSG